MNITSFIIVFLLSLPLYLSTAHANTREVPETVSAGTITTYKDFSSRFVKARNVHVWLPDGYSDKIKYPVLYMHDGHMLFDPAKTWNKQEWGVDEVASSLIKDKKVRPFIVVGIDSLEATRYFDYFPAEAQLYAKEKGFSVPREFLELRFTSDEYLRFIVQELRPFIEKNYSISTAKEDTAIMGSSMGGLISMYAISEYPDVFGMAACVSTHYPGWIPEQSTEIGDAIVAYMRDTLPEAGSNRIYYDFGTQEIDQHYEKYQVQVDVIMKNKGFSEDDWQTVKDEGAGHNEKAWNKRLHLPFTFLFGEQ